LVRGLSADFLFCGGDAQRHRLRRYKEVRHPKSVLLVGVLALFMALAVPAAWATSPHFISANVTSVTSNSITVSFKEAGLGNSLNSVNISLTGTVECINGGSNHPKASNKASFGVSGTFNVSNGQASGSLTAQASASLSCSPPMTIAWTDLVVTDTTFNDSVSIPGTFTA
jgi:hypothetical protein